MSIYRVNQHRFCIVPEPYQLRSGQSQSKQSGTALVTSLVMLLIMTMIGVGSLKSTLMQEKMAGNVWDAGAAFQATEIGLRDGEDFIESLVTPALFSTTATPTIGLLSAIATEFDYLDTAAWNASSAIQSTGEFSAVEQPPFFVIKHVKDATGSGGNDSIMVRSYESNPAGTNVSVFKITSKGSGRTASARSILQIYYAKRF
jgi:type IV pilus assembly protein PilX